MAKKPYKNLDIKLAQLMDQKVISRNVATPNQEIIEYLNGEKLVTKTACYFLAVILSSKEDLFDEASLAKFKEGKGDLLSDYMLFKEDYLRNKSILSKSQIASSVNPILSALKGYEKKVTECEFLYADLLSLDIPSIYNEEKSKELMKKLAKKGHRVALFRIAKEQLQKGKLSNKDQAKIKDYLKKSVNKGYIPAGNLLLDCMNNNVIYGSKEEISNLEDFLALDNEEYSLKIAIKYATGDNKDFKKSLYYLDQANKKNYDCTKEYAYVYYQKYLDEKNNNVSYDFSLTKAYQFLNYEYERNTSLDILYKEWLANILFTEKNFRNYTKAIAIYSDVFNTNKDPMIALNIMQMYKENSNLLEEKEAIKYAHFLVENGYKNDEFLFTIYYNSLTDDSEKQRILNEVKNDYPDLYIQESFYIMVRKGQYDKAMELYNKIKNIPFNVKYTLAYNIIVNNITKYTKKANEILKDLADKGNGDSAFYIAGLYERNGDINLAKEYYVKSSVNGVHKADYELYRIFKEEGNNEKAFEWLNNGALYGELECEKKIASEYYSGDIIEMNLEKAVMFYREAAKKGDADSIYQLGYMLYYGIGFNKDKERGAKLFEEAYNRGSKMSSFELGKIYLDDLNDPKGLNFIYKAFNESKDELIADYIGNIYFYGKWEKKNYHKAKAYYQIAKKKYISSSFYHLGLIALSHKKKQKAFKLFREASILGSDDATYEAGKVAYSLKKWEEANKYLLDSLSDERPYGYYLLSELNKENKIKNSNQADGSYYKDKAIALGVNIKKKR